MVAAVGVLGEASVTMPRPLLLHRVEKVRNQTLHIFDNLKKWKLFCKPLCFLCFARNEMNESETVAFNSILYGKEDEEKKNPINLIDFSILLKWKRKESKQPALLEERGGI